MSDEKHENFDDIAWEVRAQWQGCENCSLGELDGKDLLAIVDRFVAAHKRDLESITPEPDPDWKDICAKCKDGEEPLDCEYFGEPNGCNSPIYGKHPIAEKSSVVGNVAKMREALKELQSRLVAGVYDGSIDCHAALEVVEKALAAPPRNCDMGTAEERTKRYHEFCRGRVCETCPALTAEKDDLEDGSCIIQWEDMPHEEGGAK